MATTRVRTTALLTAATAAAWLAVPFLAGQAAAATLGRTLYVSGSGDDRSDGRSPMTAWRSLDRVNREVLAPGDQVLLQSGATFSGLLSLDAADAGDPTRPVRIDSYGTGRATISAAGTPGVVVYDTAGVEVRRLVVVGDAAAYRSKGGIEFYSDVPARKLQHVVIAGVEVRGFRHGVMIGGAGGGSGFRSVTVDSSTLHDNMATGLLTFGPALLPSAPSYAHEAVRVRRVTAYRNLGDPNDRLRNTGSGIVLGSVKDGVVELSRAYGNGSACAAPEGPVGIWTYDAHRVTIQNNVAHDNRRAGPADGGGFDLDQNVSASTLQYNTSYGNDGPGYLVYTGRANSVHRGNVVRFNISSGDARRSGGYGGITIMGRVTGTQVYNNTVVVRGSAIGLPPAVKLGAGGSGVALRNNILVSEAAGPLISSPALPPSSVVLQGNDYWSVGTSWRAAWGGTVHTSIGSWRQATGQEQFAGQATGHTVDPAFVDGRTALTMTDPADTARASGLSLQPTSPLRGRALPLDTLFGMRLGGRDYFGTELPAAGKPYDVGASQALTAAR